MAPRIFSGKSSALTPLPPCCFLPCCLQYIKGYCRVSINHKEVDSTVHNYDIVFPSRGWVVYAIEEKID